MSRFILGFETSCDETACALVTREGVVAANDVASQVDLHARFGGVVPEVASRRHLEAVLPLLETMFRREGVTWDDIESIAVTRGPGLIGCLLMGVETAKALAWTHDKPLVPVHHLEGHLYALQMTPAGSGAFHLLAGEGRRSTVLPPAARDRRDPAPDLYLAPEFPHVGLVVSGGHTSLVFAESPTRYQTLAVTLDDAVGEAYDKVARLLELGYPGGPVVDRLAAQGRADRFELTPPLMRRDRPEFSFSGLKTQVARLVEDLRGGNGGETSKNTAETTAGDPENEPWIPDLCASFQAAVIESLLTKALRATEERGVRDLTIVGGVACNRGLRAAAEAATARRPVRVWFPHPSLCTDNAAMIAGLAWHLPALAPEDALALNPDASLPFSG